MPRGAEISREMPREADSYITDRIRYIWSEILRPTERWVVTTIDDGWHRCWIPSEILLPAVLREYTREVLREHRDIDWPLPDCEVEFCGGKCPVLPEGADVVRASGDSECNICHRPIREHCRYGYPSGMGHVHQTCDGVYNHT